MRKTLCFLLVFSLQSVFALGDVTMFLDSTFKKGFYKGVDQHNRPGCIVNVFQPQDVTGATHGISVTSVDRIVKATYKVNDSRYTGGRGDCPVMHKLPNNIITIYNRPATIPCLSTPSRSNFGGIMISLHDRVGITIRDSFNQHVAFCSVSKAILN